MSDYTARAVDYMHGYKEGVADASDLIAATFQRHKEKHATAIAEMQQTHAVLEGLMLNVLAPLQDDVRRLKPKQP